MNTRSDRKTCIARRRVALGTIAVLALIAPAASAHTSAVCALTHHHARCTGTAEQLSGLTCIGIAKVLGRRVLITTVGSPKRGAVLIKLSNAVVPTSSGV